MNRQFLTLIKINIFSFLGFSFLSLFALLSSSPLKEKLIIHHHNPISSSTSFLLQGSTELSQLIKISLTLPASNISRLETAVMAASIPGSKRYLQHLTKEQVESLVVPDPSQQQLLQKWLKSNGVPPSSFQFSRNRVSLQLSVKQANSLLNTQFHNYNNTRTGAVSVSAPNISLPVKIEEFHVHTNTRSWQKRTSSNSATDSPFININGQNLAGRPFNQTNSNFCDASLVTLSCIMDMYDLPSTPLSSEDSIGITGFDGQFPQFADLSAFINVFRPDIDPNQTNVTFSVVGLDGGTDPQSSASAGNEADADVQYVLGLAPGANVTFFSVGTSTTGPNTQASGSIEAFSDLIDFLLDQDDPPAVLSTSYGFTESDVPQETAQAICNDLLQLTARGITLIFASGDGGVAGGEPDECTQFDVTFPASCPWVTSVGATMGISPEVAANYSTGGFSRYFQTPSYQQLAARKYLHTLGTKYQGLFNPHGRGVPDIVAQGTNLPVVVGGEAILSLGTSLAAPIVASVVANINAQRRTNGKGPIGFLNPQLYFQSGLLNDITSGSNPGCGTDGFQAAPGWDPASGLGSPNFANLSQALST